MNSKNSKDKLFPLLKQLLPHVGSSRIIKVILLQILSIFSSFVEAISVSAIVPFMAVIGSPDKIYNSKKFNSLINFLEINSKNELIFFITMAFVFIVIFSAFLKWLLIYLNTRTSNEIGSFIAVSLYRRTLFQPYIIHTTRNSSEILAGITRSTELVNQIIVPFFLLFNSIFTIFLLIGVLIYLNPFIIITSFFLIGLFYVLVMFFVKNIILKESDKMNSRRPLLIKSLQEGLGGIRDIIIDGTQELYCELYHKNDLQFKKSQAKVNLINNTPNIAIQSFGIALIAIFACRIALSGKMDSALPFLGALTFGYLRISPAIQQVYSSWTNLRTGQNTLKYIVEFLSIPLPKYAILKKPEPIKFNNKIELRNLSFRYSSESNYVINDLNLDIKKGSKIGIVGTTGSGKSTLTDLIMGLLVPTNGYLFVDDIQINEDNIRNWQIHIAHVPQTIFLSDNTIAENIAFGIPKDEINKNKLIEVSIKAQIFETIQNLEDTFDTKVGERGIRLSGGQRQRIGIARALYKNADVIIFDEATSALDNDTENDVMSSIEDLNKDLTIIIVAHRLTTLKKCDNIIQIENGKLKFLGNYESLMNK